MDENSHMSRAGRIRLEWLVALWCGGSLKSFRREVIPGEYVNIIWFWIGSSVGVHNVMLA